jgi:hypothetical protein
MQPDKTEKRLQVLGRETVCQAALPNRLVLPNRSKLVFGRLVWPNRFGPKNPVVVLAADASTFRSPHHHIAVPGNTARFINCGINDYPFLTQTGDWR